MINNLIELAKKQNIEMEVYTTKDNRYEIEVLNDRLVNYNISVETNYQIKAIYENKTIKLNYESLANPDEIISNIINNAKIIDNDNQNRLCENDFECENRKDYKPDFNMIKEELLKLNEYHNKYSFISNIDSYVVYYNSNIAIDNINHHMSDNYGYYRVYFSISAKKDDIVKSCSIVRYDDKFDIDDIKKEIEEEIGKLKLSLDAESVKTNKYKVLLNNNSTNKIIATLMDAFYEKNIDLNLSPYSSKFGQKLFSDKISIIEEPLSDKFVVKKHFDNEGVLTYNKEIIKDGVFNIALNSLEYAIKNNKVPTANASGTYNLHIKEGNKTYDELVKLLDNGIIITNVEGLHAGINHATGDISLQSYGFLVEDGKIVKALDTIILQSNLQELLTNVLEVGNDLKQFNMHNSSVSLLLHDITISGNL